MHLPPMLFCCINPCCFSLSVSHLCLFNAKDPFLQRMGLKKEEFNKLLTLSANSRQNCKIQPLQRLS